MKIARIRLRAALVAALLAPLCARADGPVPESAFSLSGFGTAGLTHNSTDQAKFIRDILQPKGVGKGWSGDVDSRFGLQANFRPSAEVEGVVQAVSYYDAANNYSPELTWAFVGYAPNPEFKLRAGRLGWDVYMLSDSRNIGYSYLLVRPPVDYFGQLQITHLDGADAVYKRALGGGVASIKLYAGRAAQKVPSPPSPDYDLTGTRVWGANLDFQKGDWQFRAGYTAVDIKNELPGFVPLLAALRATGLPSAAALASDMSLAGKRLEIASLGVVYERGPWQSQLMFNRLSSDTLAYPRKDSGYFFLGYRAGQWTPFAAISGTRSESTPQRGTGLPVPNALDGAVAASLASAQSRQRTLSLGARYDFMRNADLKFQVDQVRVRDQAAFLWRDPQPGWNGKATVFSIVLDFVF